ncbi:MAG TPA: hypothetical protein VEF55_01845 [Candidatus Binatia bacterium]|nr:hypothetical protein [Candidatus Binatia bacterium]
MRFIALIALFLAAPAAAQTNPVPTALDAYALYQNDVSILSDAQIDSAEALGAALERMARHDPAAVSRGWIAYNATVAAQSPAFVRGVQSRVSAAGRAAVVRQLVRDMSYARRRPPGDAEATQLIVAAVEADTARLDLAAGRYEAMGRDLDMSGWAAVEDRSARHTRLTALRVSEILPDAMQARLHIGPLAVSPLTDPNAFGGRNFWNALAGRTMQMPPPRAARERWLGGADRMRTLAGLIIVNATYTETARVAETLADRPTEYCLSLQQLQLRQCAASANTSNEDALCLARHGFAGPSACFAALLSF